MGKLTKIIGLSILGVLFIAGTSFASYLDGYTNITIYDGHSSGTGWWGAQEDQEVEPGAVTGQNWDLEGFFQSGSSLALVGGWDFLGSLSGMTSGDIFFETDDTNSGYDYVLDMDWGSGTYSVISGAFETAKTTGGPTDYDPTVTGLDWRWLSGGTELSSGNVFSYLAGVTDSGMGYDLKGDGTTGGTHNAVVVDLAFLGAGTDFTSYFTMTCGNDIVNGSGSAPVPEPATMLLLGTGLIGLAGIGRKKLMGKKLEK